MQEWLTQLDINSVVLGLAAGLLVALVAAMSAARGSTMPKLRAFGYSIPVHWPNMLRVSSRRWAISS